MFFMFYVDTCDELMSAPPQSENNDYVIVRYLGMITHLWFMTRWSLKPKPSHGRFPKFGKIIEDSMAVDAGIVTDGPICTLSNIRV